MAESVIELTQAKEIGEHIARVLMSANSVPEFGEKGVPVAVAARVFGKDATWIQAGIISGWLPIGIATQDKQQVTDIKQMEQGKRTNYYISPKKLWEWTGYVWKGGDNGSNQT